MDNHNTEGNGAIEAPEAVPQWPRPEAYDNGLAFKRDLQKALYQKQLDAHAEMLKAQYAAIVTGAAVERAAQIESRKAEFANYYTVFQAIQSAYLQAAKDSLPTVQARAQFVLTAAGAIATLYTGLLGLVYKVGETANKPLPERGIWAGIFLGFSIVMATFYFVYVIMPPPPKGPVSNVSQLRPDLIERVHRFMTWSANKALARRYFLQCAALSLGAGVGFLPAAFTQLDDMIARNIAIGSAVVILVIPAIVWLVEMLIRQRHNDNLSPPLAPTMPQEEQASSRSTPD